MRYRVNVSEPGMVRIRIRGTSNVGDQVTVEKTVIIWEKPVTFMNYAPYFVEDLSCPDVEVELGGGDTYRC